MKIIIDRSKWGPSFLLNKENGDMCCLGQAAEQCGAAREVLSGRAQTSASDLKLDARMELPASPDLQRIFGNLCYMDSGRPSWKLKSFLAAFNDAYHRESNKAKRESLSDAIVQGFLEAGYEVEFA